MRGRRALVIGGSGGIGGACAKLLVESGAKVGFTFLNSRDAGESLGDDDLKGDVISWRVNLRSDASLRRLISLVHSHFLNLDILIMCQGVIAGKSLKEYSNLEMSEVVDVNLVSVMKLTKLLRPFMAENSSIVYVSSISAQAGSYDPVYSASKGAILSFAKSMARQYAPAIRVNAVAPGLTSHTRMFNQMSDQVKRSHVDSILLNKFATPLEVANVVGFLCSKLSSHITGACLDVNGGEYLR